jgi:hypothetical protein
MLKLHSNVTRKARNSDVFQRKSEKSLEIEEHTSHVIRDDVPISFSDVAESSRHATTHFPFREMNFILKS